MTLASFGAENEDEASQVGTYTEVEVTNADTAAGLVTPPPTAQSKLSPQGPTTRSKSARKVSCGQILAAFPVCNEVAAYTPVCFVMFALESALAVLGNCTKTARHHSRSMLCVEVWCQEHTLLLGCSMHCSIYKGPQCAVIS